MDLSKVNRANLPMSRLRQASLISTGIRIAAPIVAIGVGALVIRRLFKYDRRSRSKQAAT